MRHALQNYAKSTTALGAFAVLGRAYCGALIGIGRQLFSMLTTLIVHAIGAPVGFAALSWLYHRKCSSLSPS
jgi:hypothetical protein